MYNLSWHLGFPVVFHVQPRSCAQLYIRQMYVEDAKESMELCGVSLLLLLCAAWSQAAPVSISSSETAAPEDDQTFAEVKQSSIILYMQHVFGPSH